LFKIKVVYESADSFGSEILEKLIDYEWKSIETAKKALQMIKEHHHFYQQCNGDAERRNIEKSISKKPWFSKRVHDIDVGWEFLIKLPIDEDAISKTFTVSWTGWGCDLHKAAIVLTSDEFEYIP
tara:strand:+ start:3621 stop:3995 length:375 start_codon:yes stop_codon:yes gene_type:complete